MRKVSHIVKLGTLSVNRLFVSPWGRAEQLPSTRIREAKSGGCRRATPGGEKQLPAPLPLQEAAASSYQKESTAP